MAAKKVYFGAGQVATGPFHGAHTFAFRPGLTTPNFDLARAEKLLDEVGKGVGLSPFGTADSREQVDLR